ncbi:MAG: DUF3108 domain-containing protein [Gammaproteobacteria bacterium]|nr:DUF3108 domain-containing protein [Gammaproteobacteria bacterium]
MKKTIIAILIYSPLFTSHVFAAFPPDFNATYQLNKLGLNAAEASFTLKENNDSWLYRSVTKTKGFISIFRKDKIIEETLIKKISGENKPLNYKYIHNSKKKNRNRSIQFDWKNKIANATSKGIKYTLEIPDEAIDNFSLQLRIMHDLDDGKSRLEYQIIHKGQLKPYTFEILGKEKIETPVGNFYATKIKRSRKNETRTTIMWLSPELHYLPVMIKHIEKDGTDFYLKLSQVSGPITNGKQYNVTTDEDE